MRCFVRVGCWLLVVGSCCVALAASAPTPARGQEPAADEILPRNPFWPVGYNGKRYPISAEPRLKYGHMTATGTNGVAEVSGEATGDAAYAMGVGNDLTEDPIWGDAVATLRFGATLAYADNDRSQSAIAINGRIYAVGDLVSINFKGHRLTWRVENLSSEGKITLKRLTYRKIGPNS